MVRRVVDREEHGAEDRLAWIPGDFREKAGSGPHEFLESPAVGRDGRRAAGEGSYDVIPPAAHTGIEDDRRAGEALASGRRELLRIVDVPTPAPGIRTGLLLGRAPAAHALR